MMSDPTSISLEKKALRKYIRALKDEFDFANCEKSTREIFELLEAHEGFVGAQKVLCFWSLKDEVFTHDFINKWYCQKEIYLPVIHGDDLKLVLFEGEEKLKVEPKYNIAEPIGEALNDESLIDLVLIPGMAFDVKGNRMGRGAGYYDRILKRTLRALKVGVAFKFQMVEQIPVEAHDVPMDLVICG